MISPEQLRAMSTHALDRDDSAIYKAVRERCDKLAGTPTMHVSIDQDPSEFGWISDDVIERLRRDRFHVHRYIHTEHPPDSAHDRCWVTMC
jgi:predicted O-linked N-acetylglucosamine transferase (SPINDLY family)